MVSLYMFVYMPFYPFYYHNLKHTYLVLAYPVRIDKYFLETDYALEKEYNLPKFPKWYLHEFHSVYIYIVTFLSILWNSLQLVTYFVLLGQYILI